MFIDTHAHLTSDALVNDTLQILTRAQTNQIDKIVNICTDEKSLKAGFLLREEHPWVFNAAATTPHDVEKEGESFFSSCRATSLSQAVYRYWGNRFRLSLSTLSQRGAKKIFRTLFRFKSQSESSSDFSLSRCFC